MNHPINARRPFRIGLQGIAVTLICVLVLAFSTGRASAGVGGCYSHGDGNDPARSYICSLYDFYLHNNPSETEVNYWVDVLATDGTASVVNRTTHSVEALGNSIANEYEFFLGRFPDPGGLQYWTDYLINGGSFESFGVALLSSDEAYAHAGGTNADYVDYLYDVVLDRSESADEGTYWTGVLDGGASRASVASFFLNSDERIEFALNILYEQLLGRAADADGLAYWTGVWHQVGILQVEIDLLSTAECYANFSSFL